MVEMYAGFSLISSGFAYARFCCTVALSVVATFTSSYTERIAVADKVLSYNLAHSPWNCWFFFLPENVKYINKLYITLKDGTLPLFLCRPERFKTHHKTFK